VKTILASLENESEIILGSEVSCMPGEREERVLNRTSAEIVVESGFCALIE
jgi:hypothetical protein